MVVIPKDGGFKISSTLTYNLLISFNVPDITKIELDGEKKDFLDFLLVHQERSNS